MSETPPLTPDPAAEAVSALRVQIMMAVRNCISIGDRTPRWLEAIGDEIVGGPLASLLADIAALRTRAAKAERERDDARARKGLIGPCLWGRYPGTGIWHQIDDGSHTEEEVAEFERDYLAAGWTELRRTNPFRDRLATELAEARAALKPFADALRGDADAWPDKAGIGNGLNFGHLRAAARALTTAKGDADVA